MKNFEKSYYKYWGKAKRNDNGTYEYHLLVYHCLDVAAVGKVLLDSKPELLKGFSFFKNSDNININTIILLLLCIHDFGKFSKIFQAKIPEIQSELQQCNRGKPGPVRHDILGLLLWDRKYLDFVCNPADILASGKTIDTLQILIHTTAGHHGKPASPENININDYFDEIDFKSLEQFWDDLLKLHNADIFNNHVIEILCKNLELLKVLSWELAGFITLCDWIGSNQGYFGLKQEPVAIEKYWYQALNTAKKAVTELGFCNASVINKYSLQEFLPSISNSPTPLQNYCDTCSIPDEPQLWIVEDVTGAGKIEAALILAARLLTSGLGNGIFIALPTMATSDAMYKRISLQYSKLFTGNTKPSLVLAHGARHLSKEFQESFLALVVDDDEHANERYASAALCNRWFADSNKKALLADAGVGTIDQVLTGVLPARHQALRLFGLQGKVLIVDEVHAYDNYQHRLLCGLLEHHSRNGGSAILLSATLPKNVRQSLASAYLKGKGVRIPGILKNDNYPLTTHISNNDNVIEQEQDTRIDLKRTVTIEFESEYSNVIEKLVSEAKKGKCCCWIRNTVSDVITTYEELKSLYNSELVTLLHSRYTYADRMQKERELLKSFGPDSGAEQRSGRIVIATQIIEQSLDVDFDVLISDLSPIDYIIQRLGRLFRHKRDSQGNRCAQEKRGTPAMVIYGPEPTENPSKTWYSEKFPGAAFVYRDHAVLWKTQKVIIDAGCKIATPGATDTASGIRNLLNKVYGAEALETPTVLQETENDAIGIAGAADNMGRFNMLNLSEGYSPQSSGRWYEEVHAPTRIGEAQATVYLAKIEGSFLQPFESGEYPWDLSAVKIRASLVKIKSFGDELDKMTSTLKSENKRFYEGDCIVPLKCDDGVWSVCAEIERKGPCRLVYSKERGLEVVRC
ncbi:MAG: CRISPR-associated helicase Cas3' [Fibrobacter sp.]|nr:CRISPR-associated helicase Cas3' [Fibrobacter sp.]